MYRNPPAGQMPPVFLTSFSRGIGWRMPALTTPASAAWSTTNRMIYVPFELRQGVTVYRHFWLNGSTVGTNNLNTAVYDSAFNRISVGTSTLSAGANVCQFDNVTDYQLGPGRYYMVLWCNGTTATVARISSTASGAGVYYETHASGPQTTGTPAAPGVNNPVVPMFGLALRATDP